MTPDNIITKVRSRAHVNATQYPSSTALQDINEIKNEIWSAIASRSDVRFSWDVWNATLSTVSEHSVPSATSTSTGTKAITSVSVCYDGETYEDTGLLAYVPAKRVNKETLKHDWNWYVENQSEDSPIYFVSDKAVFIAPAARTSITNGMKLEGLRSLSDFTVNGVDSETVTTTEEEMRIPFEFHSVIIFGGIARALWHKGVTQNEVQSAENFYSLKLREALDAMATVEAGPVTIGYEDEIDNGTP